MLTPKQTAQEALEKLEAQIWEARLEVAVTHPVDHEAVTDLVQGLSTEEIEAIPYLPNRETYIQKELS